MFGMVVQAIRSFAFRNVEGRHGLDDGSFLSRSTTAWRKILVNNFADWSKALGMKATSRQTERIEIHEHMGKGTWCESWWLNGRELISSSNSPIIGFTISIL